MILGILLAIAALLATGFSAVLWLVGKSAVTQEASNVLPDATRRLVDRAKNRLPEEARKRYEEEWPAGFEEAIEKRPIWAFREAISLFRGAGRIARELEPMPEPAARARIRIGPAAGSAVARASGLVARVRKSMDRVSSSVDQVAFRLEQSFRRVYDIYGLDSQIRAWLDFLARAIALVLVSFLLLHNVLGWL